MNVEERIERLEQAMAVIVSEREDVQATLVSIMDSIEALRAEALREAK